MTEPMDYDEFSNRIITGVIDKAFMEALSQNIIIDPADPNFRSMAGFIVQVTLVHLGELGRQYDAYQLAEGFIMRVSHFMQVADSQPAEEGGTS